MEDRKEGQEKVIRVGRYVYGLEESIKECKSGEKGQKGDREKKVGEEQEKGGEEKHAQCPPIT